MQITIEDLSPVEKKVEFELPWADVAPKLDKAYDSLRRGVRLPGFRPGKVPRALLERMYRRQVEDEVARELVERSLGQAIQENQIQPVAPPAVAEIEIKTGAPFKFSARVEVRSQVTPKDYAGVALTRRPPEVKDDQVAEALEGYRRRLTQFKPVDVEARKETRDVDLVPPRSPARSWSTRSRSASCWSTWRTTFTGPCPGWPAGCAASRSAVPRRSRSTTRCPRRGSPPRWPGGTSTCTSASKRCGRSRSRRWTTSWPRTPARPRRWRGCGPRCASGWPRPTRRASSARWSGRSSRRSSRATSSPSRRRWSSATRR